MGDREPGEGILEIRDVKVVYGDREILSVEALAVLPGEILAIVGPNGAGKSTLLRILALLEAPTTGRVGFDSEPVQYHPQLLLALRRRMATVFQTPLLCNTTVYGNIALGLGFRGLSHSETRKRVGRWAEKFGVAHLLDHPARTLSGGEAQRVSLARAFVLGPEVLFLDEPFSALDQPTRESLLGELEGVLRESKVTTVFVTHERNEALHFGDMVAVVMGGRLVQVGAPERVFSSPVSEEVARFVGVENILMGVILEQRDGIGVISLDSGKIQVATEAEVGERVLICLRPEEIVLARSDASFASESTRNVLRGRIHHVIALGAQLRVQMDAGATLTALITKQSWQDLSLAEGQEVQAAFKASAAHVIRRRETGRP